tara:strand:+ start:783 stop:1247 length:465 start_codon:yes stop_codon:yes gene_type:complete
MTSFPFSAGQVLTAAQLNEIGEYESFTPSWVNITTTGGTNTGAKFRTNDMQLLQVKFILGSSSSVDGSVQLTLPDDAHYDHWQMAGTCWYHDTSAGKLRNGHAVVTSATTVNFYGFFGGTSSTVTFSQGVTATTPMTWNNGDSLTAMILYRVGT